METGMKKDEHIKLLPNRNFILSCNSIIVEK
jgi:hypothetical protein